MYPLLARSAAIAVAVTGTSMFLSGCGVWDRITKPSCYEGAQASTERCRDDAQPRTPGYWATRQVKMNGRDVYYAITNTSGGVYFSSGVDHLDGPYHAAIQRVSRYDNVDVVDIVASRDCLDANSADSMWVRAFASVQALDGCQMNILTDDELKPTTTEVAKQVLPAKDIQQLEQRARSAGREIAYEIGITDDK